MEDSQTTRKLLVTGASGFLGWNLCQMAQADWRVFGTAHSRRVEVPGTVILPCDLTDFSALQQVFQQVKPDAVIHAAALSQPNACQQNPEGSFAINVTASQYVADLCAEANIPMAFTSTDLVFDGKNAPYSETDPVCPVNLYGEHKALAEVEILQRYPKAVVCRMPLLFGYAPHANSFLQPFLQKFRSGEEVALFTDEYRTPVSGRDAAKGLLLALEKAQGRLHLGGAQRLSRYEFGQRMVEALDIPQAKILACRQADVLMAAPRPPDVSMDSSLAFGLGFSPGLVRDELEYLRGWV